MKRIVFTVTNDLVYDQRMIRICTSLSQAGYAITLIGSQHTGSIPLEQRPYRQKRLTMLFKKGFGFYAEFNIRLLFHLLFKGYDAICCIDLDTILPVWLLTQLKNKPRVYDAHEYFSQQKEIITRPRIYRCWHWIEKKMLPRFRNGYTVSYSIAGEFKRLYGVDYAVIRNIPLLRQGAPDLEARKKIVLYQGAVNEARGLETLIPAMKAIDATLQIYGDGNFMAQTKKLVVLNNLQDKVLLKGKVLPGELDGITANAYIGMNLVEHNGLNQFYSLANKFFDYIHNAVPQVTMNFPEYKRINDEFEVALLINDLQETTIADAINRLLHEGSLYTQLQQNCLKARQELNWQQEEKKLIEFYKRLFAGS